MSFCAFAQLVTTFNSSQLEISHVLNGTIPEIQQMSTVIQTEHSNFLQKVHVQL
jgi:hypothetical protein